MRYITLNSKETADYNRILAQIDTLEPGKTYFFRDFFPDRTASTRVARKLYEDVSRNWIPRVKLAGTLSREGYVVN